MRRWLVPLLLLALLPISLVLADLGVNPQIPCANGSCTTPAGITFLTAPIHNVGGGAATLGAGTGACATTSTITGGRTAGTFLCTGTAGASTQIVNLPTAGSGFSCFANDDTSKVALAVGAESTTAITISGTIATTGDKVTWGCLGF